MFLIIGFVQGLSPLNILITIYGGMVAARSILGSYEYLNIFIWYVWVVCASRCFHIFTENSEKHKNV